MGAAAGPRAISGADLKIKSPNCPTGRCGIRLDGVNSAASDLWIDMNYDGGGWVLVLANRKDTGGMKNLTYSNAVNTFNYRSGTSDGSNTAITTGQFDNPNLISLPNDFVTNMGVNLGTVSNNTAVAPDGTTTAATMTFSGNIWDLYRNFSLSIGVSYRMSMYVKLGTATNFVISLNNAQDWAYHTTKEFKSSDGLSTQQWVKINIDVIGFPSGSINSHFGGNPYYTQTVGTVFVWGWELKLLTPDVNVFLPVKYWSTIGKTVVQFVSTNKTLLSQTTQHTKRYRWSYTSMTGTYGFVGATGVSDETSTGAPGFLNAHAAAGNSLTTYDNDQDTYGINCSSYYNNNPWWYNSCWSGNYFAGGGGYQDAPYWDGSGSDYHNYGAVYIK